MHQLDDQLRLQTAVRQLLPAHYSTAGAEAAAHRLRNLYEQRSFSLRNAGRTNLLLGLTRLHLNNRDDVNTYHRILRRSAEVAAAESGRRQGLNRDHATPTAPPAVTPLTTGGRTQSAALGANAGTKITDSERGTVLSSR